MDDRWVYCIPYLNGAWKEGFLVCKCAGIRYDVVF